MVVVLRENLELKGKECKLSKKIFTTHFFGISSFVINKVKYMEYLLYRWMV